jgi:ribA/ribD-fused uncharacterized protein
MDFAERKVETPSKKVSLSINSRYIFFYSAKDENGFLSQWYPCTFVEEKKQFNSCEQYMMYKKALLFEDFNTAMSILNCKDAYKIKRLGRSVKNFLQELWDREKEDIVYRGNYLKFTQNRQLQTKLLDLYFVGCKFVEASPVDRIWGIGFSKENAIKNKIDWGENLLGSVLTKLAKDLNL